MTKPFSYPTTAVRLMLENKLGYDHCLVAMGRLQRSTADLYAVTYEDLRTYLGTLDAQGAGFTDQTLPGIPLQGVGRGEHKQWAHLGKLFLHFKLTEAFDLAQERASACYAAARNVELAAAMDE